jgi:1-acyl-sn-glycerol-3-phosphate acyltransferase
VTTRIEETYRASLEYLDQNVADSEPPRLLVGAPGTPPVHRARGDRGDGADRGHLPAVAGGGAALSPILPGYWRPLRIAWLAILYLVCESVMLVILFGLWISSGFGRRVRTPYFEGIHYDLVQGLLWMFFREARRVLNLTIETAGPTPDAYPGRPLLVCCRHAGPGDSFTLIYALMHWYDREPRVVLKDNPRLDPAIDVLLHRIPARFISPNPKEGAGVEEQIAELATGLDENDAFVIFPEGGNFTARAASARSSGCASSACTGWRPRRGDDQRAGAAARRRPRRARRPRPTPTS